MNKIANYKHNFDILIKSYTNLKVILEPNSSEDQKFIMNYLIDTIISQLQIFMDLLSTKKLNKIYELLNINNQNLSPKILIFLKFFENTKIEKPSFFSNSDAKIADSNKKKIQEKFEKEKIKQNQRNYFTILQNKNNVYDKVEENNNNELEIEKEINNENKEITVNKIKPKIFNINTTLSNRYNIIKPKLINNIYTRQIINKDQSYNVVKAINKYINKDINNNNYNNNKIDNNNTNKNYNLTENSSCIYKKLKNKNEIKKTKYKNVQSKTSQNIKNIINKNYVKHSLNKSKKNIISSTRKNVHRFIIKSSNNSHRKSKKSKIYDRNITKVCHTAIDDYKTLEHKSSDLVFTPKKRSCSLLRSAASRNTNRENLITKKEKSEKNSYAHLGRKFIKNYENNENEKSH